MGHEVGDMVGDVAHDEHGEEGGRHEGGGGDEGAGRAAGEAAHCAVYPDARNPFTFTELLGDGLEAWSVAEVWMMGGPNPQHPVDITAQLDRKIAALMRHESQHVDPARIEELIRAWGSSNAVQFGLGDGRAAEAFQIIDTR